MSKKDFLQTLTELGEEQEAAEKQFDFDMDTWWNGLSKEDQMKSFYSVMKRVADGELVQKGSYRYVLQEVFGFEKASYYLGMKCGYMALHNAIEHDVEELT